MFSDLSYTHLWRAQYMLRGKDISASLAISFRFRFIPDMTFL